MRALLFLTLVGCGESVLLLPSSPLGATSVAVVAEREGVMVSLPIAGAVELPPGDYEAHYFDVPGLPAGRVLRGEGCDEGGLGAPIASYALGEDGPIERAAPSTHLRMPDASCPERDVAVVPYARVGCTRPSVVQDGCALQFDLSACGGRDLSAWAIELDGKLCPPAPQDSFCLPATDGPPAALAAAMCGDASYAAFALEPLEVDRQEFDLAPVRSRVAGSVVDILPRRDVVLGVASGANDADSCESNPQSDFFRFDRALERFEVAPSGLPCVVALLELDGAPWALFRPERARFGVARLADGWVVTASVSVEVPMDLSGASIRDIEAVTLVDGTASGGAPVVTLILRSVSRLDPHDEYTAFVELDAETLVERAVVTRQMSAVAVQRAGEELWVSDDATETVAVFRLPLSAPLRPVSALRDDRNVSVSMGPLMVARDVGVVLVGREGDAPGLDVYTDRGQTRATSSSVFVRSPEALARSIVRLDADRALALFWETGRGQPESAAKIWLGLIDLRAPERIAVGTRSALVGNGIPVAARLDGEGVLWVAPRGSGPLLSLRVR